MRSCWYGWVIAGLMCLGHAQVLATSAGLSWTLQAWGSPAPTAEATPRKGCPELSGATPVLYAKGKTVAGAGAELILPSVLKAGRAYEFSFVALAPKGSVSLDLFFRKDAAFYDTGAIRLVQVTDQWQRFTLRGVYDGPGAGSVRLDLRAPGGAVCVAQPSLTEMRFQDVGSDGEMRAVSDRFFGVHLNQLGRHTEWPAFEPDVVRLWASGTEWNKLQPDNQRIDWRHNVYAQRLEFLSKFVISRGRRSELIMTLGMTPIWAGRKLASGPCVSSPYGAGSCMPPENMESWRSFVSAVVTRYKDRIRIWELWNEADVPLHWSGSVSDLIALTRAASEEIKKIQPDAVVIGPNVTTVGMRLLHDFLAGGGGRLVDGLSFHAYLSRSPGQSASAVRNLHEILKYHGLQGKPIWNTEANTSCGASDPQDRLLSRGACDLTPSEAIAQNYLMQAALGVQNISYYTWEGAETAHGGAGLVQSNFETLTQEGRTMQGLVDLLRGARVRELTPGSLGVEMVEIVRDKQICRAFWSSTGKSVILDESDMRSGWTPAKFWRQDPTAGQDASGKTLAGNWPVLLCKSSPRS
jgi:Glycosyl hydrolases family 39